jgi:hypothetical protein
MSSHHRLALGLLDITGVTVHGLPSNFAGSMNVKCLTFTFCVSLGAFYAAVLAVRS